MCHARRVGCGGERKSIGSEWWSANVFRHSPYNIAAQATSVYCLENSYPAYMIFPPSYSAVSSSPQSKP